MPSKTKKVKAAGRFGIKYGRSVRAKVSKVEEKQRKKQKCPYCGKLGIKRLSKGIWYCKKCNRKFTSDVYYIQN
jgi:large subunit ribosomal protein L37Ae